MQVEQFIAAILNYVPKGILIYEKLDKMIGINPIFLFFGIIYMFFLYRLVFKCFGSNSPSKISFFFYILLGVALIYFIFLYTPTTPQPKEYTSPNITLILEVEKLLKEKGTEFKSNLNDQQEGVIFAIDGLINVGKTFLIQLLCGLNLNHGYHMEGVTRGTNIYFCPKLSNEDNNHFVIDKEGLGRAEGDFNSRLIGSTALNSFFYRYPHKTFYIAKDLTDLDRKNIEIMTKSLKKDGKEGYIIHNFAESTDIEDVKQKIKVQIKENFNASLVGGNKPFLVSNHPSGVKFNHFILAKFGSSAGNFYNDKTMENIINTIQNTPQRPLLIVPTLLEHLQRELMNFVTFNDEKMSNAALGIIDRLWKKLWGNTEDDIEQVNIYKNYELELNSEKNGIRFKKFKDPHKIVSVVDHFRENGGINVNLLKGYPLYQSKTVLDDNKTVLIEIEAPGIKKEDIKLEKYYTDPIDKKTYILVELNKKSTPGISMENNRGFGYQIHQVEILPMNLLEDIKQSFTVEDGIIKLKMKIK